MCELVDAALRERERESNPLQLQFIAIFCFFSMTELKEGGFRVEGDGGVWDKKRGRGEGGVSG